VQELAESYVGSQPLSRYRFSHALFQDYLYADLGLGERRLLHGEIAAILEELYAGREDQIAIQLAHHYSAAGRVEKATWYLLKAGDQARALYAHEEAIAHYQRAVGYLKDQGDYQRAAGTLMNLGLTYHTAFDFEGARAAYEEGFAFRRRAGLQRSRTFVPAPHPLRVSGSEPLSLDPALADDTDSTIVLDQLFSGLIASGTDMAVLPDIAKSWEVMEGGRKYLFHLRDDAAWSDGRPVTAADFEFAWKRVLDPSTNSPSPTAELLYDIKGAQEFHLGTISDSERVGVRAIDEFTLEVELERPSGYFLYLLTHPAAYPAPAHIRRSMAEPWRQEESFLSNGPFQLRHWRQGESISLIHNPNYHGLAEGNVEQIELIFGRETSDLLESYSMDDIDVLFSGGTGWLGGHAIDAARRRHAEDYLSLPALRIWGVGFDTARPPFDDVRVRRAFVLAVDRRWWIEEVEAGTNFPATGGLIPPGMPGHSPDIGLPYDPEAARALLSEAGYPDGSGFPPVLLLWSYSPVSAFYCQRLQQLWKAELGVEVRWEVIKPGEYYPTRLEGDCPHLFQYAWQGDYPDPDSFLRVGFGNYPTGWEEKAYIQRVEQAMQITDQEERMQLYQQADRLLIEAAAVLPLTYSRSHLLIKPWVTKYPLSAMNHWMWKDVVIEAHE
jgi:oligopeptide transport system substrate-binding protein